MGYQNGGQPFALELNAETLPIIEQITAGMPGGFFIYHADGNEELIYANRALVNIFGCDDLEDLKAHIGGSFRGLVHPEDLEWVSKSIHRQIMEDGGELDYVEYRINRKDGVVRWIRDYGRFVHTGIYGDVFYVFVEDATERHLKELSDAHMVQVAQERLKILRQLEHETTALRMVHEIISSGMWSMEFNERGEMVSVFWSDEFRAMLGYHDETDFPNVLESWSGLLHEEDKERVLKEYYDTIEDYTGRKTYSVEYRLLTKDRGWRWFQAAGKPSRRPDGTPITYVGIFVDITRQKLTDEALETQRRLLEDALLQTQRANRAKSLFLSNMSHDIHTPMNAVMGFATLAKLSLDDKAQAADYLDKILTASHDLQTLLSNVLDMSRIESSGVTLDETPCVLTDILKELEDMAGPDARAKGLTLTVKLETLMNEKVYCDRWRLNQALMNVLNNAVKFTPSGGEITVQLTQRPGAPAGYGFYIFRVKDTGIGMSKEFLQHAFEPFERERTSTISGLKGTGLGMAIAKSVVEMMGGAIRAESEEGKGSEFTISIQFRLAG